MIKFSVVIPTYMEERHIGRTLRHIKNAAKGYEVEIIVVDSNSSDGTREIASLFDVKVINTTERGISRGRNIGAAKSNGDIIFFLDADAIVPDKIFRRLESLFSNPNVIGAACNVMPDMSVRPTYLEYAFYRVWAEVKYFSNKVRACTSGENGIIVRKTLFEKLGGFDERLPVIEDYDFVVRASRRGRFVLMKDIVLRESIRRFRCMGMVPFCRTYLMNWIYYSVARKSMIDEWRPVR